MIDEVVVAVAPLLSVTVSFTEYVQRPAYRARAPRKNECGGYPHKLVAPQIALQMRMMTVSDIFDALSAAYRHYKKVVIRERALDILDRMVRDGELDGNVFRLFVEARVYEETRLDQALA